MVFLNLWKMLVAAALELGKLSIHFLQFMSRVTVSHSRLPMSPDLQSTFFLSYNLRSDLEKRDGCGERLIDGFPFLRIERVVFF